jgi:cold shock CspA family protein
MSNLVPGTVVRILDDSLKHGKGFIRTDDGEADAFFFIADGFNFKKKCAPDGEPLFADDHIDVVPREGDRVLFLRTYRQNKGAKAIKWGYEPR